MNNKIYILPLAALALGMTGCDDQIMDWRDSDGTVVSSEIPLEVREKLALYKPIKEYMQEYHPETQITNGMGLDLYLDNDAYRNLVNTNFQGVTFGNAMKHSSVVSASGKTNWSKVDRFLAMNTGLSLHGHNLLWHTQQQQAYMKSLIAPKLIQTGSSEDGITNILPGDASDFEGGTTGGWSSWGSNKKSAEVVKGVGRDGSKALVLENNGDGSAWEAQCAYTFDTPLKQNVDYKIRFYAKADTGAGKLQFQYQNGTTYGSQGGYNTFDVGTDWTLCEYTFKITDYDDVNRIILNFGQVGGKYIIDDIRFGEYKEPAPDPMTNMMVGDDSDFEGGTLGKWSSWGGNKESAEAVQGAGKDGSYGMVLKNKGDGNAWDAQCAYTFDTPLKQNVAYIIQFDAKSDTGAGELQFQYQNGTSYGSQGGYNTFNVGTDWVRCEYEFTIADYDDVDRIILNFGKVGGTYNIDNIKFGEKTAAAKKRGWRAASFHYELKSAAEKREILLNYMEEWIKEAMTHVDVCTSWDVINEPIDDNTKWRGFDGAFMWDEEEPDQAPEESTEKGLNLNWKSDHWYWGTFIGKDYGAKAFEFAAKYNTNGAKLFVNDYNLETSPSKLKALIEFVQYIDNNGGHVDGIGTQMHVGKSITKEQVDAMFKTLAATGKLVRITELDVALGTTTPSAGEMQTQSDIYQMIITSYFENVPEVQRSAITMWGVSDKPNEHEYWLKDQSPNIWDANYARKTAYKGVCDGIAGKDISVDFNGDEWKNVVETEDEDEK